MVFGQNTYEMEFVEDKNISDKSGKPISEKITYLPEIWGADTTKFIRKDNYFRMIPDFQLEIFIKEFGAENIQDSVNYHCIWEPNQKWYSRYLYEFNEPLLYNYYLGREIIRFTLLRSFDKPLMIKIEKRKDSSLLHYKILEKQLDIEIYGELLNKNTKRLDVPERFLAIERSGEFKISNDIILQIMSIISKSKLKNLPPSLNILEGEDGAAWILEVHQETGYYYIERWSPEKDDAMYKIAEILIETGKLNEKLY